MATRKRTGWVREKLAWKAGELLCGIDEVGTGAWAGPVYAGAVVFPAYVRVPKLMDSKMLRAEERERVAEFLMSRCVWSVGCAEVFEIFELGLRGATFLAMERAFLDLGTQLAPRAVGRLAIDALRVPFTELPQESIIRGDAQVASIAAAAIIAKVHRDRVMKTYGSEFSGYGFELHKGYGTKAHQNAILRLGACSIHRMNFAPFSGKSIKKA